VSPSVPLGDPGDLRGFNPIYDPETTRIDDSHRLEHVRCIFLETHALPTFDGV